MTDSEPTNDRMGRRTVLKTAAAVGVAGAGFAGSASADDDGWKSLRFQSTSDDAFEYHVTVSGTLERTSNTDAGDELIDGHTAEGACSRQRDDGWRFKGEIEKLELSGPGKVYVDGELVEDTSGEEKDHDDDTQHHLRFQSTTDELFSYRVKVTGTITREANRDGGDTKIDEHTAEGRARGGNHDDWLFTGGIEDVELSGPGKVLIDGEEYEDPTDYDAPDGHDDKDGHDDNDGGLPKEVVVSSSIDGYRDYAFAVSGDAEELEPNEDGVPAKDEVVYENGRTVVRGTVGYGDDRFAFSGEITPIEIPDVVRLDVRQR